MKPKRADMGLLRGKLPGAVYELSEDQVQRWRDGDQTVWAERTPGLLDRLTQPGVPVIQDPKRLAEAKLQGDMERRLKQAAFEAEAG